MKKLLRIAACVTVFVMSTSITASATPGPPEIGSAAGILFETSGGKVLWQKDATTLRAPASLTKILTALVALEHADLDDTATISARAREVQGGRIYAETGWSFTVEDLLYGLLLQSGNDAAIALAERVSPDSTVEGFMKLANDRAAALGATATNFVNPHGLDAESHLTTAADLAVLSAAALREPTFRKMVATKTADVPWGDGKPHTFINHNKLLWQYPEATGIKTGFTNNSGSSLASSAERSGNTLVAILLGSPDHYGETKALFNWGFENLGALKQSAQARIQVSSETPSGVTKGGLTIVQLPADQTGSRHTDPLAAPLLGPLAALATAFGIRALVLKARRRAAQTTSRDIQDLLAEEASRSESSKTAERVR